jgi:hypothetical protein
VANGTNIIDDKNFNRTDDIRSGGWKSELKLDSKWTATLDVGLSKATRHERLIESIATGGAGSAIFNFSGLDNESNPAWSTNQDLTNPANVQLTNNPNWAQMVTPSYTDQIKSLRLNFERTLDSSIFSKLQFGANQTRRDKVVNNQQYQLTLPLPPGTDTMAIPTNALAGATHISMGGINNDILAWNVPRKGDDRLRQARYRQQRGQRAGARQRGRAGRAHPAAVEWLCLERRRWIAERAGKRQRDPGHRRRELHRLSAQPEPGFRADSRSVRARRRGQGDGPPAHG